MKVFPKRKQPYGGLQVELYLGQSVEVVHSGEALEISYTGSQGKERVFLNFKGSKVFQIVRSSLKEKESE